MDIDFVVTWVDGADKEWQKQKAQYSGEDGYKNGDERYRDWDTLKYLFRGVEKFAPWVRKIHFVTNGQVPQWLNTENEKIHLVNHTDIIPEEYLPTFNSNAIEWNIHKIEGLSENFVYFNDDMFLIDSVDKTDFFKDNLPCDTAGLTLIAPVSTFAYLLTNDAMVLNRNFDILRCIAENRKKWYNKKYSLKTMAMTKFLSHYGYIINPLDLHLPISYKKDSFTKTIELCKDEVLKTCSHRIRSNEDIIHWVVRYCQLLKGEFTPRSEKFGRLFSVVDKTEHKQALDYIENQRGKTVCLNDGETDDFDTLKSNIITAFEKILPDKCSFER